MRKVLIGIMAILTVFAMISCDNGTTTTTYTVTFNANGATAGTAPQAQSVTAGGSIILPEGIELRKDAQFFGGWNTEADGSGDYYAPAEEYTPTASITLYVNWSDNPVVGEGTFTVTFDKNNTDAGSTAPDPATRTVQAPATTVQNLPTTEPTRVGYVFKGYNTAADGSGTLFKAGPANLGGTIVTSDMTVYAQWQAGYTVTFSKNNSDGPDPSRVTVEIDVTTPGEEANIAATDIPTVTREAFQFQGWNLLADPEDGEEDDTAFSATTTITDSITVYAQWKFVGGTPKLDNGKIVVDRPMFTVDAAGNNELDLKTGYYKLGATGYMDFMFPTVGDQDANTYDYFIILTEKISGEPSSGAVNVQFMRIPPGGGAGGSDWGGAYKNAWLTNDNGKRILYYVSGADTPDPANRVGGFRILTPSGTSVAQLKIKSFTFYKAPRYTVTFKYGYGSIADKVVNNVMGKDAEQDGFGVGDANWPAKPDRSTEDPPMFFIAWKDADNFVGTAASPVTKDTVYTAEFTDEEPEGWMELIANSGTAAAIYGFPIPAGKKAGDYTKIVALLKAGDAATPLNGRFRVWGPYAATGIASGGVGTEVDAANGVYTGSMGNAGNGLLMTPAGDNTGSLAGGALAQSAGWKEYTLDLTQWQADYNTTGAGGDSTGKAKFSDATGTVLLGIGLIGGGSQPAGPRAYYIKELRLTNADGTDSVFAEDPKVLFTGALAPLIQARQEASSYATRTWMYPDE